MSDESEVLARFCVLKLEEMTRIAVELGEPRIHARPALPGANSVAAIVVHCCGMMRRWSSTVNLGVVVPRDRDAEFRAAPSLAELLDLVGRTVEAFERDVERTRLAARPHGVPEDRESFWTGTCGGVLLHVLEELSQHLGQVEITRDVLLAD